MLTSEQLRQANGAKQYLTVGIVFQRSLLVTTVVSLVLVLPVWLNIGQILTHLGAIFKEPAPCRVFLMNVSSAGS